MCVQRPGAFASPALRWLVTAAAIATGTTTGRAVAAETIVPREAYERPATRAVLPDGRRLNFVCEGTGAPTVLLESGFGAGAYGWAKVERRIAQATRVCAYDRAGYGFSDPGPLPRDGAAIARDLDRGLKAAHIRGPYVLVGHSAGGLYMRLFAARRRRDVVGVVFVDSSVEHQVARTGAAAPEGADPLAPIRRRPAHCLEVALSPNAPQNAPDREACLALARPGPPNLGLTPQTWKTQLSELDTLFAETSDEVDRVGGLLRNVPAIVLTASKADGAPPEGEDPGAAAWRSLHAQLAGRFVGGQQRLVKSGHLMMNDRPEVVAGAALELVQKARGR
jgi:pimeloyl-ACP methyl ester carboxylesterase